MIKFERINEYIMRLKVPFENIYTAVFLVKTTDGYMLIDAAAGQRDVEEIILPALRECVDTCDIKYLFCTHLHGDHGGGIRFLLPHLENAKVSAVGSRAIELYGEDNVRLVRDGDELLGLLAVHLPGHSHDACAIFDARTGTLISGDAVQLYGITRYGCGVGMPGEYKKSLLRLLEMPIETLVASHEYYPLGSIAKGDGVKAYINEAIFDFERICDFVKANSELGDAVKIASAFTEEARKTEPDMPMLQSSTVKTLLSCSF